MSARRAGHPARRRTWLDSDRVLARFVRHRVVAFLHVEAAGGIVLAVAAVVALVWANSPWEASYASVWNTTVVLRVGSFGVTEDLRHWVNDGLMAIFFFVVGLEIKRELVAGELRDRRAAVLPAVAALGGMVVPALLYLALNPSGPASRGWGIPMATDIAFATGVLSLLGSRIPSSLKLFLLTLAIVDDIGAIVVIAVFYTGDVSIGWLTAAVALVLVMALLKRAHVRSMPVYVVIGCAVWLATFRSGVHATIAGVALGLLAPARPHLSEVEAEPLVDTLEGPGDIAASDVRRVNYLIRESVPVTERLEDLLHPWTSFAIVPLFALANAGIAVSGDAISGGATVAVGVVVGLVAGKVIGISGAVWLAGRLGLGGLPAGASWSQVVGVSAVAGIGFTVSLFVTGLAFAGHVLQGQAKIGVLAASALAAVIGTMILLTGADRSTN